MIELIDVVKKYKDKKVIDNVNLNILEGEFIVVLGKSGSGKTTLLNILGGLTDISSGKQIYNGKIMNEMTDKELSKLRNKEFGFVFQNYNLDKYYSVYENIEFPLIIDKQKKKEYDEKIIETLKKLDIFELKDVKCSLLSGGESQRVSIARAIINDAKVVFADEPTGALDTENALIVMELFASLNKEGKTIVLVTHNEEYKKYATRVIEIKDGSINDKVSD